MAYTGITGTVPGSAPNNDLGVICGGNLDLSGVLPPGQIGNCYANDGDLWIGSTALTAGGTHARLGNITSSDGSIKVTNTSGNINLSGSAQGFQPNAVLQEFDDFLSDSPTFTANQNGSKLQWFQGGSTPINAVGTNTNPGIWSWGPNSSGSNSNLLCLTGFSAVSTPISGPIATGGGAITMSWVVQLTSLSGGGNTYNYDIGFSDYPTLFNQTRSYVNAIYFTYTDSVNGGNWQIKCTNASVTTTVNTNVAPTTAFTTFTIIVNSGGTSVSFYINNVQVGTAITTNIPTAALTPFFQATRTAGTMPVMNVDLFWITINLSNPRPGPTAGNIPANNRLIENYTATGISYQVLGTDAIIGVTSTAAPRTITMPNSNLNVGQRWTIKDESMGAGTNNITVSGNGFNIGGSTLAATSVINTNGGSIDIYWSGSNFFII